MRTWPYAPRSSTQPCSLWYLGAWRHAVKVTYKVSTEKAPKPLTNSEQGKMYEIRHPQMFLDVYDSHSLESVSCEPPSCPKCMLVTRIRHATRQTVCIGLLNSNTRLHLCEPSGSDDAGVVCVTSLHG